MTVEVCSRMQGVRSSSPTGSHKEEASSPSTGAVSLPIRHIVSSETSSNRPKFMITDILSHQRTIPSAGVHQDDRLSPSSSHHDEVKDLRGRHHQLHLPEEDDDEDDIDLDGDASHDEDSSKLDSDHDGSQPPCKKQRKARTAFSDQQLQTLEKSFERQKYLSVQDRMELAAKLNLTDTQVKTWYQNRRTKWKRQTAVGLELLAEAGNYAAVQRLYGSTAGYGWPYPPQPSSVAAAAAMVLSPSNASSMDLYYRQAALQKPLAYRLFPPGLSLLPQQTDPLRPDPLRPEALRPDMLRPELLRSLVSSSFPSIVTSSLANSSNSGKTSLTNSPLTCSSSPLSASGSPPHHLSLPFYRSDATSQV